MKKTQFKSSILIFTIFYTLFIFNSCTKSGIENHFEEVFGEEIVDSKEDDQSSFENENVTEDDEDEKEEEIIGSITAKINGQPFKTPKIPWLVYGANAALYGEYYYFYLTGVDVELGLKKARGIGLVMTGKNFNTIEKGKIWNKPYTDLFLEGASGWYSEQKEVNEDDENNNDDDSNTLFDSEELESIYIIITAIDHEKGLISGEFNFKGTNKETGITYTIADGEFVDIQFEIEKN